MADKLLQAMDKRIVDLEKRVKMLEAKMKSVADNMTDPKEIKAFVGAMQKQEDKTEKDQERLQKLMEKQTLAEVEKLRKNAEKIQKDLASKNELMKLEAKLIGMIAATSR